MSTDLFSDAATTRLASNAPLADRMRPAALAEVVGQPDVVGAGGGLRRQLDSEHVPNMVLVGPPGTGKTTIARLVAAQVDMHLDELSAVAAGLADVRKVIEEARQRMGAHGTGTILFLDEIHRFNKAQQDALLPAVEAGVVRLIGATTENPYVSLNRALSSRLVIYRLRLLDDDDLTMLLERALADRGRGLARHGVVRTLDDGGREEILRRAGGDARAALTLLEASFFVAPEESAVIDRDSVLRATHVHAVRHDRAGDRHYDTISAYIKSMRAGDVEGALRWLAEMLEGGEDPMFISRRLAIFASEDVGPADPTALVAAHAALGVVERIGMPEARITLSQVTRHCAEAPKSRQAYEDIDRHMTAVREGGTTAVPTDLRNQKAPRPQEG